jgi:hypothetical protein
MPSELLIQKAQEFRTMTQGAMRVEEYECHFMKMMRYTPDDTNTDQKKQFWFLRGLRQGLKASEHKSLRHLVNRAIAVQDKRRSHEEHMRGKKRTGDQDHHDRSFQKTRSGQSNMLGTTSLGAASEVEDVAHSPEGGTPATPADWRLHPCAAERRETCRGRLRRHLLRVWQAWPQVLRLPRQEDHCYTRESTCPRRSTSSGCTTAECWPWEAEPPHQGGGCGRS